MIVTIPEHYRLKGLESRGPVIILKMVIEKGVRWVKLEAGAQFAWAKLSQIVTIPERKVSLPVSLLDRAPKLKGDRMADADQRGYTLTLRGHEDLAEEVDAIQEEKIDDLYG